MVIFIKKIKTKEGINSFDNEKVKKSIPAEYKITNQEPIITLTANHILIAYRCEKVERLATEAAPKEIKAAKAALAGAATKAAAANEKAKANKANAAKKAPVKKSATKA